ncbi:MAG: hypothetical protein VR64_23660 [Desulfatitalea sp. BRH_c12]|nr:MAG: hypothetical protein VR64_23660 [Desulfatitalea sp. BRH_c12]
MTIPFIVMKRSGDFTGVPSQRNKNPIQMAHSNNNCRYSFSLLCNAETVPDGCLHDLCFYFNGVEEVDGLPG